MKAKKVVISLGLAGVLVGGTIWGFNANAKQETQDKEQPKTATVVKETKAETKKPKPKKNK